MSRKAKPIRLLTSWPDINDQIELAGAVRDSCNGDHVKWKYGSAIIMTKAGGFVCAGTRASVIRMCKLAGLPILLSSILVLTIAIQFHLV